MVEVCAVCGDEDVVANCDECGVYVCDKHCKDTGKGTFCPECFG